MRVEKKTGGGRREWDCKEMFRGNQKQDGEESRFKALGRGKNGVFFRKRGLQMEEVK